MRQNHTPGEWLFIGYSTETNSIGLAQPAGRPEPAELQEGTRLPRRGRHRYTPASFRAPSLRRPLRQYLRPLLLGSVLTCALRSMGACLTGRSKSPARPAHHQSYALRPQSATQDADDGGTLQSDRLKQGHAEGVGRRRGTVLHGAG